MLFKVGKEGSVREVLKAGGIVSHDVGMPWDEEVRLAVAVFPLVGTSVVAEIGRRPVGGDRLWENKVSHLGNSLIMIITAKILKYS